jgi:desulfoferrodoxin (superoxide reductase-like protein)
MSNTSAPGICYLVIILLSFSCNDSGSELDKAYKTKVQKYYSAESPGRWSAQAKDHDLDISLIEDAKGKRAIEVSVPFTNLMSRDHYIESIELLDDKDRLIASKKFERGEHGSALFEISDRVRFPVYVVAKCNMHDMWRKKVTGKEKDVEQ